MPLKAAAPAKTSRTGLRPGSFPGDRLLTRAALTVKGASRFLRK